MQSNLIPANRKSVLIWLFACICMVMAMVVVGGLTRLTDSGLSMVEWKPLTILPPMSEEAWDAEFTNYKLSPQYHHVNKGMSVDDFKGIFWLEYIHRLLGRFTGLVFFLPFVWLLVRRQLPRPLTYRLIGIFLLGGAQGFMGWYMVKSGLVDVPWVSPLRLMAHLSLAFLIFSILWWHFLRIAYPNHTPEPIRRTPLLLGLLIATFLQIMLGALVAGLDAGLLYDSFPMMNGRWVPDGIWIQQPWWKNLYANAETAHFLHRAGALGLTLYIISSIVTLYSRSALAQKRAFWALGAILVWQIILGAWTVMSHVSTTIATLHQWTALLLLASVLAVLFFRGKGNVPQRHSSPDVQGLTAT